MTDKKLPVVNLSNGGTVYLTEYGSVVETNSRGKTVGYTPDCGFYRMLEIAADIENELEKEDR